MVPAGFTPAVYDLIVVNPSSTGGALDCVEAGALDAFGEIVEWRTLPTRLPAPRTTGAGTPTATVESTIW